MEKLNQTDRILELVRSSNGQVTNSDVENIGISRRVLARMAQSQILERLAPGVYIDPLMFGDDMAALQYRFSKGVFYKSSALFLHGMIDRTPDMYEMNFPRSYYYPKDVDAPLKMYRQVTHLFDIGIEMVESPDGHLVKAYNVERTLCDIVRKQQRTDAETIKQAMTSYANMADRDAYRLVEYSKIFKVEKEIRRYMEVLL